MKISNQVAQGVLFKLQGSSSVEDVRRVPQKQAPKNFGAGSASVNNFMLHSNSNNQTQNFNSLHGTLNVHKHPKTKQKFLKMMPINNLNAQKLPAQTQQYLNKSTHDVRNQIKIVKHHLKESGKNLVRAE